jgi:hypothetical protein
MASAMATQLVRANSRLSRGACRDVVEQDPAVIEDAVGRQCEGERREQADPELSGAAAADRQHEQGRAELVEEHQDAPGAQR